MKDNDKGNLKGNWVSLVALVPTKFDMQTSETHDISGKFIQKDLHCTQCKPDTLIFRFRSCSHRSFELSKNPRRYTFEKKRFSVQYC